MPTTFEKTLQPPPPQQELKPCREQGEPALRQLGGAVVEDDVVVVAGCVEHAGQQDGSRPRGWPAK